MSVERSCPEAVAHCLRSLCLLFGSKHAQKKKNEGGIEELEEEEFQFTPTHPKHHHHHHSETCSHEHKHVQPPISSLQEETEDSLSVRVSLKEGEKPAADRVDVGQEDEDGEGWRNIGSFNFRNNLEPYDQYYPLIENKTSQMQQIFESKTKNILTRNAKSMVRIQEIETISGFKMLISYRLPCSYAFYSRSNRDIDIVSVLNPTITGNRIVQAVHPNLTLNHLSFKKFMLLEPRFFHYVKYENSTLRSHWEICASVKARPDIEPTEKECELTSISCFQERKEGLVVNSYLQVDLKSNLRASKVVLRVYQELASYLDSLYDYAASNYHLEQL